MNSSGVYAVVNQLNERTYIGGTNSFNRRWKEHHYELKNGTHHSHTMQADYNVQGDVFDYVIVEALPDHLVLEGEQIALDHLFQNHESIEFYNLASCARASRLGLELSDKMIAVLHQAAVKTYTGFVSSEGVQVTITNMSQFCRENGLNIQCMSNLSHGWQKSHRGWRFNHTTSSEAVTE